MASSPSLPPTAATTGGSRWTSWLPSLPNPLKSWYSKNPDTTRGGNTWFSSRAEKGTAVDTTPDTLASTRATDVFPLPPTEADTHGTKTQTSPGTVQTGGPTMMTATPISMLNPMNWWAATPVDTFNSEFFGEKDAAKFNSAVSKFRAGQSSVGELHAATASAKFDNSRDRDLFEREVWKGAEPKHIQELQSVNPDLALSLLDRALAQLPSESPTWASLAAKQTNVNVARLTERLKTLEECVETLKKRLSDFSQTTTAGSERSRRSSMGGSSGRRRRSLSRVSFDDGGLSTLPDTKFSSRGTEGKGTVGTSVN